MDVTSTELDESTGSGDLGRSGDRSIGTVTTEQVTMISPQASLRDAATMLRRDDVSIAVVGDLSDVEGVISERDLVSAIALGLDLDATTAADIESKELTWAAATSSIDDVAEEMLENYLRHVLVRNDDGSLAGVVSMRDLLATYLV